MKKKTIVLGVAGALAVAGGGAAIGATQINGNDSQAVINDAAQQLGVSPGALSDALKTALKHQIDAAVAAGRLSKAEGDQLKARIDAGGFPLGLGGGALGHHGIGFGAFGRLDAAASYLGLTQAQLRTQLQSGKTLAQIAKAQGKSTSGLEQAITASVKARLDKAVAKKRITSAQEQKLLKALSTGIDAMVNVPAPRGPRFGGPGPGYQRAFKGRFPRPGSFTPAAPAPGAPAVGVPAPAGPFA